MQEPDSYPETCPLSSGGIMKVALEIVEMDHDDHGGIGDC